MLKNDASAPGIDPTYYGVRQLDVFPAPITPIEIAHPAQARNVAGRVNLLLLIGATGAVDEISVIDADPPGVFEEAALRVFSGVQFAPAERSGRPVRARLVVEVNFGR